jgi:hypothetical protein
LDESTHQKAFISFTCYGLKEIRDQLRSFLSKNGCDPILSEYNYVFYDPKKHTFDYVRRDFKTAKDNSRRTGSGLKNVETAEDIKTFFRAFRQVTC